MVWPRNPDDPGIRKVLILQLQINLSRIKIPMPYTAHHKLQQNAMLTGCKICLLKRFINCWWFQLSVKEKDQAIRKYEQEVDSLIFRNNQLSTRVGILQQELEEVLTQGKKHKVIQFYVSASWFIKLLAV